MHPWSPSVQRIVISFPIVNVFPLYVPAVSCNVPPSAVHSTPVAISSVEKVSQSHSRLTVEQVSSGGTAEEALEDGLSLMVDVEDVFFDDLLLGRREDFDVFVALCVTADGTNSRSMARRLKSFITSNG